MPIGTGVHAARAGTVLLVEESFVDGNGVAGEENYVNIRHEDGSIAGYVHLTQDGALVAVGEPVRQGQLIAASGHTGSSTAPHLHFHVQRCSGCETIPVTFRNTSAHSRGLQAGEAYLALPY
jgi:murein DD-endopeptidase MepM/ murein hydrolase activator NlpD